MFKKQEKSPFKSVLFVCTGNICRSPLAKEIAVREAKKRSLEIKIDSAATNSWHIGEKACDKSLQIAIRNGINIDDHRARQLVRDDKSFFDLIVIMDRRNAMDVAAFGIKNAVKLGSYGFDGADVPDPYYYKELDDFQEVYEMIEKAVIRLFEEHFDN